MHNFVPLSRSILFAVCARVSVRLLIPLCTELLWFCARWMAQNRNFIKLETRNCDCMASHYFTLHRRIRSMLFQKLTHIHTQMQMRARAREMGILQLKGKSKEGNGRGGENLLNVNK